MSGKFVANTVRGSHPGQAWPEEIRERCIADLVAEPNIHKIARRYKVPESTIRGWLKKIKADRGDGEKSTWDELREDRMRYIAGAAARGSELAVESAVRRLERNAKTTKRAEAISDRLIREADSLDQETRAKLLQERTLLAPLGDYPLANYLRTLDGISRRAEDLIGGEPPALEAMLAGVTGDEF